MSEVPPGRPPLLEALLLLGLSSWLFLFNLGAIPFLGKDEPKNAEVAREMMERGDWVTPTLGGEPWFDKPILIYWAAVALIHLLGPGELAARLPSALFGAGAVLLTWAFARKIFDASIAVRSGVILATSLEFFWFSRTAVTDIPLAFCVTLSLVAFFCGSEGHLRREWAYPLAFAAAGGAVLAKGPVGAILPALVAGSYLLFVGRLAELRRIPWIGSLAAFLLIAAPWYVMVALRHGPEFWSEFIVNRNLLRYTSLIHRHPGPVYYYLPILVIGLFPWGALFPFAAWAALRRGWRSLRSESRRLSFLLLWVLLPLLFFSFAGSKLPSYLLPVFPALAILTAWGWREIIETAPAGNRLRVWGVILLVMLFPVLMLGIYRWARSEAPDHLRSQIPLGAALTLTGLVLAALAVARRHRLLFRACAAGTVASLTALAGCSFTGVREEASLTRIAAEGVRLSRAGETVVAYKHFHNYLYFYTENRVPFIKRREELERLVDEQGAVYCFVEEEGLESLAQEPSLAVEVLDRQYKVTLARVGRVRDPGTAEEAAPDAAQPRSPSP